MHARTIHVFTVTSEASSGISLKGLEEWMRSKEIIRERTANSTLNGELPNMASKKDFGYFIVKLDS